MAEQKSVLLGREYTNIKYSSELGLAGRIIKYLFQTIFLKLMYVFRWGSSPVSVYPLHPQPRLLAAC